MSFPASAAKRIVLCKTAKTFSLQPRLRLNFLGSHKTRIQFMRERVAQKVMFCMEFLWWPTAWVV